MSPKLFKGLLLIISLIVLGLGVFTARSTPSVIAECTTSGGCNTPTPTPSPNPETVCQSYSNCSWYDNSCHCNTSGSNYTPTPTPGSSERSGSGSYATPTSTPTNTTTSTSGSTTDRLAQVGEATLSCIKTILTSTEIDRLRFLQPTNEAENIELENLKSRASICFQSYDQTVRISEGGDKISFFPQDQRTCLISQLGELVFNDINSGKRLPTQTEKSKTDVCFKSGSEPIITFQTKDEPLGKEIENCLVLALGRSRFSQVSTKTLDLTLAEREISGRCFGAGVHPLQKTATFKLPEKVDKCLETVLGDDKAKDLESGKAELTEVEKVSGKKCFDNINTVQQKLLPTPPKEVPFLKESKDVNILNKSFEDTEVSTNLKDKSIVLSGKALPKSLVDLFIFSEPIVVSTETDANGDWVYKLNNPLGAGSHIAYAVSKDKTGTSVRSSIYNFEVLAAETTPTETLLDENKASVASQNFVMVGIVLVVAALAIVGLAIFIIRSRRKTPLESTQESTTTQPSPTAMAGKSTSDGQGESKTGTGPVN